MSRQLHLDSGSVVVRRSRCVLFLLSTLHHPLLPSGKQLFQTRCTYFRSSRLDYALFRGGPYQPRRLRVRGSCSTSRRKCGSFFFFFVVSLAILFAFTDVLFCRLYSILSLVLLRSRCSLSKVCEFSSVFLTVD